MFTHPGRKLALLIGNSYITNPDIRSVPARDDVNGFKKLLIDRLGFKNKNIYISIDNKIMPIIKDFLKKCKENDLVLIYYSGHGKSLRSSIYLPKNVGLCSSWVDPDNTTVFSYHIDQLLSEINIKCKIILLSDSCYSGEFLRYYKGKNTVYFIGSSSSITKSSSHIINGEKKLGGLVYLFDYLTQKYGDNINFDKIIENSKEFTKNNGILRFMCLKKIIINIKNGSKRPQR